MDHQAPLTDERLADESVSNDAPEKLLLAPSMQVEQSDAQAATIYLALTGTRIRVPRALYDLLLRFETAQTAASVAAGEARLASAIAALRTKGFLVAEAEAGTLSPQRLVTDPPVRLFDCPAHKLAAAGTDVVVIGVPYDLSDAAAAGARRGPAALRETSLQMLYGIDRRTGQPQGWFDADLARPILRGVSIGDCGDVFVDPGERQVRLFGRVAEILTKVTGGSSLPVLLGGDAAISFPAIEFLQARQPLAVIRIGGASAVAAGGAPSPFVSPSTLPERILALPGVSRFVQVGASGPAGDALPGLGTIAAAQYRSEGMAALERCLGDSRHVYVGLDLSVLGGPGDAAGDGPGPESLAYCELHSLLRGIGERYGVAGLDLVGANPLKPGWNATAMTAVHLLMTALSAAKDRDEGEAKP
jgi:agmatinase